MNDLYRLTLHNFITLQMKTFLVSIRDAEFTVDRKLSNSRSISISFLCPQPSPSPFPLTHFLPFPLDRSDRQRPFPLDGSRRDPDRRATAAARRLPFLPQAALPFPP